MRSTPIILDRLRHLRYDLQAIWDLDRLMDGGFISILDKEVNPDVCASLLWFGLISEDPHLTMKNTKEFIRDTTGNVIIDTFSLCTEELFNAGWFFTPSDNKPDELAPENTITIREHILNLVKVARYAGIDEDRIWKLTPAEIEDTYKIKQDLNEASNLMKNYRMGTICQMISGGRFTWKDFLPKENKPQTSDEIHDIIRQTNAALGGTLK